MPFSGGYSPSPSRGGGGDANTAAPLIQRVFESIALARGPAYSQELESVVGAENMAIARAIALDLYGSNQRFANEMNPPASTVAGLLPRWEKILGVFPLPGDTQPVRQQRVATALLRFGFAGDLASVGAAVQAATGLFTGFVLFGPSTATQWYPWYGGSAAKVTSVSGNLVTVAGLTNVPSSAPTGASLVLSNASSAGNDGTFPVKSWVSASSVVVVNNGTPSAPDYGVGGSSGSPTIRWTMPYGPSPFMSTIQHVDVALNPAALPGYQNPDGTVNYRYWQDVNSLSALLDWMLPADHTYSVGIYSSHGGSGFYLDEPNLDLEFLN